MFTLELDYVLHFVPPMSEHGGGISFTRTIELPFAPFNKLNVFGSELEDCPYPPGLPLRDVSWDMDRGCFLATTVLIVHGPVAEIPDALASLRDRGWRPGSFQDRYHADDESEEDLAAGAGEDGSDEHIDVDELERLEREPPRRRPRKLNELIKALVRAMVESGDNLAAAYALDKTGFVFTEGEARHSRDNRAHTWMTAYSEYERLSADDRHSWRRKTKRYRAIQRIQPFES